MKFSQSPYSVFGNKYSVSSVVWSYLGSPSNYIEPFFGTGNVLISRPDWHYGCNLVETVNDTDCFIVNFWRCVKHDVEGLVEYAYHPIFESEYHARRYWLECCRGSVQSRVEGDPEYYDVKVGGWWLYCMNCCIGSDFRNSDGPWHSVDGMLVRSSRSVSPGINRCLIRLSDSGTGTNRSSLHSYSSIRSPYYGSRFIGCSGELSYSSIFKDLSRGVHDWLVHLCYRFSRVRVCCGDWSRVLSPSYIRKHSTTGIFFDPPYSHSGSDFSRCSRVYFDDDGDISSRVRSWCIEHGNNSSLRIALCGYSGEHDELESYGWSCYSWVSRGGYGVQGEGIARTNRFRERIWFSPHCVSVLDSSDSFGCLDLFDCDE